MTEHISDDDLARGESLAEEATPGPWMARGLPVPVGLSTATLHAEAGDPSTVWTNFPPEIGAAGQVADADFIAFARTALPALIAEVQEHRARQAAGITGAMAEAGARALFFEDVGDMSAWDEGMDDEERDNCREWARVALTAALGGSTP